MDNLTGSSNLLSLRFPQHSHTTHSIITQSNKNTKISKKKQNKTKSSCFEGWDRRGSENHDQIEFTKISGGKNEVSQN